MNTWYNYFSDNYDLTALNYIQQCVLSYNISSVYVCVCILFVYIFDDYPVINQYSKINWQPCSPDLIPIFWPLTLLKIIYVPILYCRTGRTERYQQ